MKVEELIKKLSEMPSDAEVAHLWDGRCRTAIQHVWLSKGGYVVTSDNAQTCYDDESRPELAPTREEDPYWETPDGPSWGERYW